MADTNHRLVVIVGETASGKSNLAMRLAKKLNGEIICADSRTIYKGMDIGTAKPSKIDQKRIKHHLLDIILPDVSFTAAEFKYKAEKAIADILSRGKTPIMVGGTGLYVDAVIFRYTFSSPGAERDEQNPRHLKKTEPRSEPELIPGAYLFGTKVDKEDLKLRIKYRVEEMIHNGLETEVKNLKTTYGWEAPGLNAIGYKEWKNYFEGTQSLQETRDLIIKHSTEYAKRQRTWFKRNKRIQWSDDPNKIVDFATTELNK